MTDVIKRECISTLLQAHDEALRMTVEANRLLLAAKGRLAEAFSGMRDDVMPYQHKGRIYDYEIKEESEKEIRKQAWRAVIDLTGLRKIMSCKRRDEIDRQVESGEIPAFSEGNINALLGSMVEGAGDMLQESVQEVFEFLRPCGSEYKTNTEYEIGPRVVKKYWFECRWRLDLRSDSEQSITALDNVLHLLDGKPPVVYPGDLLTKIREACRVKQRGVSTEYVEMTWFNNGNCHLHFLRMDLIQKLNAIAGGNRLKHDVDARKSA